MQEHHDLLDFVFCSSQAVMIFFVAVRTDAGHF